MQRKKTTRVRVGVNSPNLLSIMTRSVIDTIAHDSSIRCEMMPIASDCCEGSAVKQALIDDYPDSLSSFHCNCQHVFDRRQATHNL
jgi:hypothetical protein